MTIMGVSVWRFVLGVIASEAIPVLLLVLAMFFVGMKIGGRCSPRRGSRSVSSTPSRRLRAYSAA